jgi:lysophospholipase L1-like esterase
MRWAVRKCRDVDRAKKAAGRSRLSSLRALGLLTLIAVASFTLSAPPASAQAGTRTLALQVMPLVREQEPRAVVRITVRAGDREGRRIGGARCAFVWRQGTRVVHRSATVTGASGAAVDRQVVAGVEPDVPVRVTVRCRWRGQVARATTWFVQRPPLPRTPRIVFVGDSLTVGLYATTEATAFRSLLAAMVPCTASLIASAGGRSDSVDLTSVTAAAGDIYVIELGTNDASGYPSGVPVSSAAFASRLRAIGAAARAGNPGCRLVFLTLWQGRRVRRPYDARISAVATAYGDHVVDIGPIKDRPEDSKPAGVDTQWGASDGWHPNDAGHAAIAVRLGSVVRGLLRLGAAVEGSTAAPVAH